MTTRYDRGRRFEYRVRDQFVDHFVIRAAGSRGVADLVVLRANERPRGQRYSDVLLVQCKKGIGISMKEAAKLGQTARDTAALAVVALWEEGAVAYYPLYATGRPVMLDGLNYPLLMTYLGWRSG